MKIITSRKLRFRAGSESFVTEGSNIIQDCPDWVATDLMFVAAKKAGILNILESAKSVKKAEQHINMPENAHDEKDLAEVNAEMDKEVKEASEEEVELTKAEKLARRKARREAKKQLQEG